MLQLSRTQRWAAIVLAVGLVGCSPAAVAPTETVWPLTSSPATATATPAGTVLRTPSSLTTLPPETVGPVQTVVPSPSAAPSATPGATVSPTPAQGGWTGPIRVSTRDYGAPSLIIDGDGVAHAVAVYNGIYYLTNGSGSWTRERLSTPLGTGTRRGVDTSPSVALDVIDGSLSVAFVRYGTNECDLYCQPSDPQGIFLVTGRGGSWSTPERIVDSRGRAPRLQARDGVLQLAYQRWSGGDSAIHYAHASEGRWSDTKIVSEGYELAFQLRSDGSPVITFWSGDGVYLASADSIGGPFVTQRAVQDAFGSGAVLALDDRDQPHIAYYSYRHEGNQAALYTTLEGGNWSAPEEIFPGARAIDHFDGGEADVSPFVVDIAVARGVVHVISENNFTFGGLWYASNVDGSFTPQLLRQPAGCMDCLGGHSQVAVDSAGRPHILFQTYESPTSWLWYDVRLSE